jgi:hypothetical protein
MRFTLINLPNHTTRIAYRQRISWNVFDDHTTGTNHGSPTNCHAGNNNHATANPTAILDCDWPR